MKKIGKPASEPVSSSSESESVKVKQITVPVLQHILEQIHEQGSLKTTLVVFFLYFLVLPDCFGITF